MFTGIIQNQAKVLRTVSAGGQIHFSFRFLKPEKRKLELGESIAVNGVCLTVVKIVKQGFEADAVRETLQATTLGKLSSGEKVNTERALRFGDPLGGHFVTGHVDAVGKILKIQKAGRNLLYTFSLPAALKPFIAVKGSVVIDGISLTVQAVNSHTFDIAIVPHTFKVTSLSAKKAGSEVNLEADLVARYLKRIQEARALGKQAKKPIKMKTLRKQGF